MISSVVSLILSLGVLALSMKMVTWAVGVVIKGIKDVCKLFTKNEEED